MDEDAHHEIFVFLKGNPQHPGHWGFCKSPVSQLNARWLEIRKTVTKKIPSVQDTGDSQLTGIPDTRDSPLPGIQDTKDLQLPGVLDAGESI